MRRDIAATQLYFVPRLSRIIASRGDFATFDSARDAGCSDNEPGSQNFGSKLHRIAQAGSSVAPL
jgi:hypothetical protein